MNESSPALPSRFWFCLMFYGGPKGCFEFELQDGAVRGFVDENGVDCRPTTAEWSEFEMELDQIGVWKWKPRYEDEFAPTCGAAWNLEIEWGSKRLTSTGYERFPRNFKKLVKAAKRLCAQTT